MSHSAQNTSLSLSTRLLYYLGPPSTILLTSIASPTTALLSPVTFLPTAWFLRKWHQSNDAHPSRRGELEPMIWIYASAGTVGLTAAVLVQLAICKAATTVLFPSTTLREYFWSEFQRGTIEGLTSSELSQRAEIASSWQNWVFNAVLTFAAAGLVEETLKYLPIAYARRRGTVKERKQRNRAYIDYAVAGALSFGVVEGIGFIYATCMQGGGSWSKTILTLVERTVLGQVGHLSMAALTALRAIRRDYYGWDLSWWQVIGPSVLFHGTFNFVAMAASSLEGNVGWIHPTGVRNSLALLAPLASLVATSVWQVSQEWKTLNTLDQTRRSSEDDSHEE